MKLVFASNNKHKLGEISEILNSSNIKKFEIVTLNKIGFEKEIEETGSSLEQNALIKADTIFNYTGLDCFADDSGLEVEALGGRPGVYSARYAGENCTFAQNNEKLLNELKNETNRKACFRTVIALILEGEVHFFEGKIDGNISINPSGISGFGYDPVFVPEGYDKSFAEMSSSQKNSISHRNRAFIKMAEFLAGSKS